MIKCPSCGNEISESAPICPHCGYSKYTAPPNAEQRQINIVCFIIGVFLPIVFSNWGVIALIVGGFALEVVISIITAIITFVTGSRSFRIVYYFMILDLGVGLGCLIRLLMNFFG